MKYPVIYLDLPTTIRSFVRETEDGYTIVINPRLSIYEQQKAYKHEVEHIEKDDLHSGKCADQIETERHESEKNKKRQMALPPGGSL